MAASEDIREKVRGRAARKDSNQEESRPMREALGEPPLAKSMRGLRSQEAEAQ